MKIYIAFSGEYSSRGPIGVFTSESKARECSDDIEEYEIDEYASYIRQNVYSVQLYMTDGSLRGGSVTEEFCQPNLRESSTQRAMHFPKRFNWILEDLHQREAEHAVSDPILGQSVNYALGRSSQSQEEALKLAAEARQAYLRDSIG